MFERYTEKARRVIFFARYEASNYGCQAIESEHLMLGLLREDSGFGKRLLGTRSSADQIRADVEKRVKRGSKVSTSVDMPLSQESRLVLAFAAEEAESLGHERIGTEHLALGLLRVTDSLGATLLTEHGVRLDELREQVRAAEGQQDSRENHSGEQLGEEENPSPGGSLRRTSQRLAYEEPYAGFRNESFLDFNDSHVRGSMERALSEVKAKLGREYEMVIGGERRKTPGKIVSVNPARPREVVGVHQAAGEAEVEPAIQAALAAFPGWSRKSMHERAELLFHTAGLIRLRKFEFCAWLTYEVGKNWAEADADVAETIDFLEFYGREAQRLNAAAPPIQFPGERNWLRYLPLGVGAVIPPWNFPLAIMAGMTAASIVCGNTVILKPSVDAPTIAAIFFEVLVEAGLPPGVVNFCPGEGPDFGAAVVAHPETRFVAFTGSKKVGLEIHESAAKNRPGQKFIRRTILEMGGKDAIIVDADCDLDAAVEGVVASAFGFNGQKCSACSRAIVDRAVYDGFCEKLVARVGAIQQGDPAQNSYAGPVISRTAYQRVLKYIEIGRGEGRLIAGGGGADGAANPEDGYYIQPTVFRDVRPDARIAQEEIFGPVLAVIPAADFDEALAIANGTEYGLTGAVYSRSREKLARAGRDFHVGNLYFNRKCTGAMVGAHPFGGFNMSGTDSKAGGPDYLLLFTQAKSIAEKRGTVTEPNERHEKGFGL